MESESAGRRTLPALELRNPLLQPTHTLHQLIRVAKPHIDWTCPLVKSPQQFGLRIANPFGQRISNLPNGFGDTCGRFFGYLPNSVGKILLSCGLTVHS
jgi:hypothetical protein